MDLKAVNAARWQKMVIPSNKGFQFKNVADKILMNKARYQAVSAKTGVPWEVIGVIHYREAACNFNTYLGNGEPLTRKTRLVPKGRGPFSSWEEGALDALVNAAPKAALNKDWSIGGTLEIIEKYNGLGYASKGLPSPYVWAGTNQYVSGKYVRDGVYDPNHVDTQLGCAGVLKYLGYKKPETSVATTATVVVGGAAATATASRFDPAWQFFTDHWIVIVGGVILAGLAIDFGITLYKNRKNK